MIEVFFNAFAIGNDVSAFVCGRFHAVVVRQNPRQ
jgi:hypothetical protein